MPSENDYKTTKLLGSGRFGQVFLANKKGKCFAVKKFHTAKKTTNVARQELYFLKQVEHRHLVKYYGHYMEEKIVCLVLEYADKGTMEKFVLTQDQEEWDVWRFTSHVASALDYLHSKEILHFNLKPCKILGVTEPSRNTKEPGHRIYWKLTDVGATKTLTRDVQEVYSVGNLPVYIGPEVLTDLESYTAASDIWSLACVTAFYMRGGEHLFNNKDDVLKFKPGESRVFDNKEASFFSTSLTKMVLSMLQEGTMNMDFSNVCPSDFLFPGEPRSAADCTGCLFSLHL